MCRNLSLKFVTFFVSRETLEVIIKLYVSRETMPKGYAVKTT